MMLDSVYKITAIASVGFNVMFIGGYTWQSFMAPAPTPVQQPADTVIVDDLNLKLNETQKQALSSAQTEQAEDMREAMQNMYLAQQALWSEMAQPAPDSDRIQSLQSDVRDAHDRLRELRSQQFNAFLETLTPEQRQSIADRSKDHYASKMKHHRERLLEHFDTNGDGQLDDKERAAAREHFKNKKRKHHMHKKHDKDHPGHSKAMSHEERRQKMLEKYDLDGDGELSREEKRKAMQDRIRDKKKHRDQQNEH